MVNIIRFTGHLGVTKFIGNLRIPLIIAFLRCYVRTL